MALLSPEKCPNSTWRILSFTDRFERIRSLDDRYRVIFRSHIESDAHDPVQADPLSRAKVGIRTLSGCRD